ncbi:hypothetical protein BTM25_48120 [Actinomadura rubteroloni]|uniref:Uncharacterized protein n=1 Tax=Actinomadura rubteroloni TaxID=1926885 RepID=A0A2P4UF59_9ACTN|nr:hypothetical protein [Actinomadura rubteroloni]POM23652.1 hypothetical protein BTM25_48120 [Actinomadura rubteroloni]
MHHLTKTGRTLAAAATAALLAAGLGSTAHAAPKPRPRTLGAFTFGNSYSHKKVAGLTTGKMPASSARHFLDLKKPRFKNAKRRTAKTVAATETPWTGSWHMDWGVFPSVQVYGAAALQSVNPSIVLPAGHPDDIYAPTLLPANQSCIEMVTTYLAGRDSVSAWDWCRSSPGWSVGVTVDSAFTAKYTAMSAGHPVYAVQTLLTNAASNTWTSYLWNFTTSSWDTFYTSSGGTPFPATGGGWDMWEVYTDYDATTGQGAFCDDTRGAVWESSALAYSTSVGAAPLTTASTANSTQPAVPGDDGGCDSPALTRQLVSANSQWRVTN